MHFSGERHVIETLWLIFNQNIKQELCSKQWNQHNRLTVAVMLTESLLYMCAEELTMELAELIVR